jgi:hypothetical protein
MTPIRKRNELNSKRSQLLCRNHRAVTGRFHDEGVKREGVVKAIQEGESTTVIIRGQSESGR